MASESFFDNTAFFHTTYGMLHFNPDSGNPLVLLLFNSSKLFSSGSFWACIFQLHPACVRWNLYLARAWYLWGVEEVLHHKSFCHGHDLCMWSSNHTIRRLLVHNRLFFMLWVFFTTIACWLPVFIQRTLNRSLCFRPTILSSHPWRMCIRRFWNYGPVIHQAFSMYAGEYQKEGESIYWPGAGSSQTE